MRTSSFNMRCALILALACCAKIAKAEEGSTTRRTETTLSERLDNGLEVVVSEAREQPIFGVVVRYRVGNADDPRELDELAHLAEHLSFRRSRHLSRDEWTALSNLAGVRYNASTGDDDTTYVDSGPIGALPRVLWLERQRMAFVLESLSPGDIVTERRILEHEQATVRADRVGGMFWHFVSAELYPPEHPYAPREEGGCIRGCELRHAQWLLQRGYRPDNARLVVVGDFDAGSMLQSVQSWFGSIENPGVRLPPRSGALAAAGHREITIAAPVTRPRVHLFWRVPEPLRERFWPLTVLDEQLRAVLVKDLVRGAALASDVASGVIAKDLGWLWAVEIELLPGADPARVAKLALARIEAIGETARAVDFARKAALTQLLESWEHPDRRAALLADLPRFGFDRGRALAEIEAVSAEEQARLAQAIFRPGPALTVYVRRAVDASLRGELYRQAAQ